MSKWTDEAKRFNNAMARQLAVGAKYVPADKYNWSPGGVARSAAAMLCEAIQANHMFAKLLRGEQVQRGAGDGSCTPEGLTYDKAKGLLDVSMTALDAAIDQWADKDLTATLPLPWGPSMAVEAIIFLPGTHMNYHNGQLNYIQTLLGDAEPHRE